MRISNIKKWERKWNLARFLRKDDNSPKAQELLSLAEYVYDAGDYYILFKSRFRAKRDAFQLKMSEELYKKLKEFAKKEGMSMSEYAHKLAWEYQGTPKVHYRGNVKGMTASIIVYMDEGLRKKLIQMADNLGVSMSEVLRGILEEKLNESKAES